MTKKLLKTLGKFLLPCIAVFFVVGLFSAFGIFKPIENKTYDYRVKTMPELVAKFSPTSDAFKPSDDIVLILINQESLTWAHETFGWSWPWPREAYARYLDFLGQGEPAACAFDIMYTEPSAYGADDDRAFANSLERFHNAILPVFFTSTDGVAETWGDKSCGTMFSLNGFEPIIECYDLSAKGLQALFPTQEFTDSVSQLGNVTSIMSVDGVIRSASLFYQFDNVNVPALSSACFCLHQPEQDLSFNKDEQVIYWNDQRIPVEQNGESLLRFKGSIADYYPYSMKDILESSIAIENGEEPFLSPDDFSGKYIFTFLYGPGLYDICYTPISPNYPGAGIHITMLDNLLKNDFITRVPQWVKAIQILVIVFTIIMVVSLSSKIWAGTLTAIFMSLISIVAGFALYVAGWWLPIVSPVFSAVAAYLCSVMIKYFTEGRQKRYIKTAFKQYLSPVVIEQLIDHPERLKLGGERREISIFFSDIQGFTSISEKLDPQQLTDFLNTYLSCMSDVILESGGTIDKYEGDAIIAFWNAPAEQPDHAERALSAALKCHRIQEEMQQQFMAVTGKPVKTRIGLNTGYAVVGNMGSRDRFDYTMIGDSVNLAARLEGLNKQFGTYLMCSQSLLEAARKTAAPDTFHCRTLASVAVIGREEAVTVLEPIQDGVWPQFKATALTFEEGYRFFYDGNFEAAAKVFATLDDEPARRYLAQCNYFRANPSEWLGYWVANTK